MTQDLLIAQKSAGMKIAQAAKSLEGTPYSKHTHPHVPQEPGKDFSCWAFVNYSVQLTDLNLFESYRHVRDLWEKPDVGIRVLSVDDLAEGDILLFRHHKTRLPPGFPGHCGIYLGEGKAIHNSWYYGGVVICQLDEILQNYALLESRRLANATD